CGAGNDLYIFNDLNGSVTELAGEGTDEVRTSVANYTLSANVEILTYTGTGSFGGTGSVDNNIITGGAGNDSLRGMEGVDTLNGGSGNDTLDGGLGADILNGGDGIDAARYLNAASAVVVNLKTGVHGGEAQGDVYNSIEIIEGSLYNDTLTGDAGDNIIKGYGGSDVIEGGAGADTLDGWADNPGQFDTVSYAGSSAAVSMNFVTGVHTGGDAAGDVLTEFEIIAGSAFGDTFVANAGTEITSYRGGAGNDLYIFNDLNGSVTELAGEGTDEVRTSVNYILSANVENLTYTGTGNFSGGGNADNNIITGGTGNDSLSGNGGNDTLIGGDGNDLLQGGTGADLLIGGSGTDTAYYVNAATGVTVNLATGVHTGEAQGDVYDSIEIITGSNFGDILIGDAGDNRLNGSLGSDLIEGGAGADILDGFANAAGDVDTVTYANSTAISMNFVTGVHTGGHAAGDVLSGFEVLVGSAFSDTFVTSAAGATASGITLFKGGAGNDVYIFNDLNGSVTELAGEGTDEVRTSFSSHTLSANVENLTYTGSSNFSGYGNNDVNVITGGAGSDTLVGYAGSDTLIGGAGNDTLTGGTESDVFVFASGFGKDTITDFVAGSGTADVIQIDDAVFADLSAVLAAATQVGADTVITYDANNTITLKNVTKTNLHVDDFQFV
ncbi:beta strand repeat-containing protein, partial [Bosea sp. NPDC055332]